MNRTFMEKFNVKDVENAQRIFLEATKVIAKMPESTEKSTLAYTIGFGQELFKKLMAQA